jgi:glycosyltransferase involved in cell wall biosynthesis
MRRPLHILFVNYHHLDSNSGIHIFNLANQLTRMGVECTVCVPDSKETTAALGQYDFKVLNFDELRKNMQPGRVDLIHAWTPRECVRTMTEILAKGFEAPYIVHLEDNEEALLQSSLGMPYPDILALPESRLDKLVPAHLSHPIRYKKFLDGAEGLTTLMDTLQAFSPGKEAKEVIWPGYEEALSWHRPPDESLRQHLHIRSNEYVIAYTGNVHPANRQEVFSLYLAVELLNRRGIRTKLIRTGTDFVRLYDETLSMLDQYCIPLGRIPRSDLPSILSVADVLVQPGRPDAFNIYRFPSKLPEYLASGKPVLLPAVNIGRFLKDGEEAILLQQGTALEIAQKLEALFPDQQRRERIGAAGRQFAENNLRWQKSAEKLRRLYQRVIGRSKVHSKIQNAEKPNFSIIVFQMGKVGSKTVQESLIRAYESQGMPVDVYHSHILCGFDEAEAIIRRERPNPEPSLAAITDGRKLRKVIDESPDNHHWKIISLVRDPVARNIATFFDNLNEFVPNWREQDDRTSPEFIPMLQQAFLNVKTIHSEPYRWFDEQLLPVFGVDVFAESFPRDTGYKIYHPSPNISVLVIRLEDLDRIGGLAVQEFLGLDDFELFKTNVGEEKSYAGLYQLFKQAPLPEEYIQETYSTKYAKTFYTDAERIRFSLNWSKNKRNEQFPVTEPKQNPIIVYQMGKVGSKTIEQSLLHFYQTSGIEVEIYHAHFLNYLDEMEKNAVEAHQSSHAIKKIREAQDIRRKMEENPRCQWNLVSLVRDPVARNIAGFFQNLSVNQFIPDWKTRYRNGTLQMEELQDAFLKLGDEYIQHPANWFDTQLKPIFNIDVFESPFPHENGYKIYSPSQNARLLVIRMEDINRCASQALDEFLGLKNFTILNSNLSAEKDYTAIYEAFKSLPLPMDYVDKVYSTKYARHFYSKEEITGFKQRWTRVKPSLISTATRGDS